MLPCLAQIDNHPLPDFASDGDAGRQARELALPDFPRLRRLPLQRVRLSVLDDRRAELDRIATGMLGIPWHPETGQMLASWPRLMCLQPAVNANNRRLRYRQCLLMFRIPAANPK